MKKNLTSLLALSALVVGVMPTLADAQQLYSVSPNQKNVWTPNGLAYPYTGATTYPQSYVVPAAPQYHNPGARLYTYAEGSTGTYAAGPMVPAGTYSVPGQFPSPTPYTPYGYPSLPPVTYPISYAGTNGYYGSPQYSTISQPFTYPSLSQGSPYYPSTPSYPYGQSPSLQMPSTTYHYIFIVQQIPSSGNMGQAVYTVNSYDLGSSQLLYTYTTPSPTPPPNAQTYTLSQGGYYYFSN